jgi:hypothetical protein
MLKHVLHTTIALGGGFVVWSAVHTLHTSALTRWEAYKKEITETQIRDYFLTQQVNLSGKPQSLAVESMPRADLQKALYTALGHLETCELTIDVARRTLDTTDK